MVKLDVDNINKLIALAKEQGIALEEQNLIQFILMFEKITKIINSSEEEYELKLGDYKLVAKYKNYKGEKLTINVKKNRR